MHRRRPIRSSGALFSVLAVVLLASQSAPVVAVSPVPTSLTWQGDGAAGHQQGARAAAGARLLWSERIGTDGADTVFGVVVHEQGIYIHGETLPISSFREGYSENQVFVQRWSLAGDLLWTHTFGEPETISLIDQMTVSPGGDVTLVTGPSAGGDGFQSHASRALLHLAGDDGEQVWRKHLGAGPVFGAVLVSDEAVFTASTWKGSHHGAEALGGFDAVLTRFDIESGEVEWVHQAGSPKRDGFEALAMGPDGLLYASGSTSGAWRGAEGHIGGKDSVLTRVDPETGRADWATQFGTARNDQINVRDVDRRGVTVSGMTVGSFPGFPATEQPGVALRFSLQGKQRWVDQLPSSTSYAGDAETVGKTTYTVGRARDDMATVGRSRGMSFLRAVRSSGEPRWTAQFAGDSQAYRVAAGESLIVVVGETYDKRAFGPRQGPSDGYITVWKR